MGTPAEHRSILGHLINVSRPYSYSTPDFQLICQGVEGLSEEFEPDTDDIQYICEDTTTRIVKSYTISFELELKYMKNSKIQNWYNEFLRKLPTGSETEIDYIRFNKAETMYGTNNEFIGIRRKATAYPTSIGGEAGDPLTCGMTVSGTGAGEVGYVTISTSAGHTSYSWTAANTEVPIITEIGGVTMPNFYDGTEVSKDTTTTTIVKVKGKGITGGTISVLKANGEASSTTATVGSDGNWTLDVTYSELAVTDSVYTAAFQQTVSSNSSVTTIPYRFKVV